MTPKGVEHASITAGAAGDAEVSDAERRFRKSPCRLFPDVSASPTEVVFPVTLPTGTVRIAYITAGAAGNFCGSCMHDNTLVAALTALGHDALLIPTYTPIRTDEPDMSQQRVFFGGINVYLQQKLSLFRHTPWTLDRVLDAPGLLRWVSRFAVRTQAADLGELTLSMLQGELGRQRKEVDKLVQWLAADVQPEIVNLTNMLLSGMIPELKRRLTAPVLATLQGDDIFLEALPEPHRSKALQLIRAHCTSVDGFIATSAYYADFMAGYFGIPRTRIHVIHPGLSLAGHGGPRPPSANGTLRIGYFARICPEKGLHVLAEAFRILRQTPGTPPCRLHVAGWLGENNRRYFEGIKRQLAEAGLADQFAHEEAPDHASKVRFLQGLDILSVPTTYREPKGLYVLEALANGVPVVQPRHGSFPELLEATGGGLLVEPENPHDLARGLQQLLENRAHREELGRKGKEAVHQRFHAARMAQETIAVYQQYRV
jgi:glycosyltransferase involved in cell wall biosynthesis